MGDKESPWTEIDRRLEGDPLEVGGRTVQPVGRLKGKQITAGNANGWRLWVLGEVRAGGGSRPRVR